MGIVSAIKRECGEETVVDERMRTGHSMENYGGWVEESELC